MSNVIMPIFLRYFLWAAFLFNLQPCGSATSVNMPPPLEPTPAPDPRPQDRSRNGVDGGLADTAGKEVGTE